MWYTNSKVFFLVISFGTCISLKSYPFIYISKYNVIFIIMNILYVFRYLRVFSVGLTKTYVAFNILSTSIVYIFI